MKRIVSAALVLFVTLNSFANDAQTIDEIVAVVGDNIVLKSEVELSAQEMKFQGLSTMGPDELKCNIVEELLLKKLYLVKAEKDSVQISPEEVEAELDLRVRYFINYFETTEKLEEFYGKSVYEIKDDLRDDVREQLLAKRVEGSVFRDVKITPKEVKAYFATYQQDSLPIYDAEVQVGQIAMMAKVSEEQEDYARQKIEQIREDIKNGADFSLKARLYSEDPGSAKNGGDLGFIERGQMVHEFEAAAFRLRENEISEIVKTQFGYHLIKMDQKRGQKIKIRHILVSPKITSIDLQDARKELERVVSMLNNDSITFEEAVKEYSEDENTKNSGGMIINPATGDYNHQMKELEPMVALGLEKLDPGQYTKVLTFNDPRAGKQGFRVIYLAKEIPAHKADIEQDYQRIQKAAIEAKKQKFLIKWIEKESKYTYIKVNEDYQCPNFQNWGLNN